MTDVIGLQSNLTELRKLDRATWQAFKEAEKKDMPPVFRPVSVMATLLRLRRQGRLKLHQFYPLYGLPAIAVGAYGVVGPKWLVAVYLLLLVPTFIYLARYIREFAFDKTKQLGLDEHAFGVPNLPLLVNGTVSRMQDALVKVDGPSTVLKPTKERLASVIKLVKCGHDYGSVGYGLDEQARRWVYAGLALTFSYPFTNADQVPPMLRKVIEQLQRDTRVSIVVGLGAVWAAMALYSLMISPANEKRRKLRYQLVLNAMHESWPAAGSSGVAASDAASTVIAGAMAHARQDASTP